MDFDLRGIRGYSVEVRVLAFLWFGLSLSLVLLQATVLLNKDSELFFLSSLDRQHLSWKMRVSNQYRVIEPSGEVEVLRLAYDHGIDFWEDRAAKEALVEKLARHSGPIVVNLSPGQMLRDSVMSRLFSNPNFIRPFEVRQGTADNYEREKVISHNISQPILRMGVLGRLLPDSDSYFSSEYLYGGNSYRVDRDSYYLQDFDLLVRGSGLFLPSSALQVFYLKKACQLQVDGEFVQCVNQDGRVRFDLNLPLQFYTGLFTSFSSVQRWEPSDRAVLVYIDVGTGKFSDYLGQRIDWAELNATVVSNLLQGDHLRRGVLPQAVLLGFVFLSYLLLTFFLFRRDLKFVLSGSVLLGLCLLGLDLFLTAEMQYRTYPAQAFVSFALMSMAAVSMRAVWDARQRFVLEAAFRGYVSDSRLRRIMSGRETLKLSGRRQRLSIVILDIVRFSDLAKGREPEEIFELVKRLFSVIDPIILEFGGVIDKKLGDGMIAFFGDDDEKGDSKDLYRRSAQGAVDATCKIQEALKTHSDVELQKIKLRIGVNSGEALLGNAGSAIHFDYTVLGAAVNFTQRLESACTPGNVLLGKETMALIKVDRSIRSRLISVKNDSEQHEAFEIEL